MSGYTKAELRLKMYHYYDLASAVVRQWRIDGRPQSDKESVKAWARIAMAHNKSARSFHSNCSIRGLTKR